jgi:hypothetical protein
MLQKDPVPPPPPNDQVKNPPLMCSQVFVPGTALRFDVEGSLEGLEFGSIRDALGGRRVVKFVDYKKVSAACLSSLEWNPMCAR